jgi:signal transduction histidine kinase
VGGDRRLPRIRLVEALRRAVEPFYSSKPMGKGSGLGLSLVAAVARLHHGAVALTDNKPGLAVTIRVPIAATG